MALGCSVERLHTPALAGSTHRRRGSERGPAASIAPDDGPPDSSQVTLEGSIASTSYCCAVSVGMFIRSRRISASAFLISLIELL